MRENELCLYCFGAFAVLHGLRGFLEGSLDAADQALLKHRPSPTPHPDDVSRTTQM